MLFVKAASLGAFAGLTEPGTSNACTAIWTGGAKGASATCGGSQSNSALCRVLWPSHGAFLLVEDPGAVKSEHL